MTNKRECRRIARRIALAAEIERAWKDVEEVYGSKAARELKKVTPADPLLLYDMMVLSWSLEGKNKKEVQAIIDSYADEDWENDMRHFNHTIKMVKKSQLELYEDEQ